MNPTRVEGQKSKLGVCLSGGGFRATLFHLGVLKRLAELDLLRDVSVLSCVSGGSILGAHYLLALKPRLEASRVLRREDYEDVVRSVEEDLRAGIKKCIRTRLLWNPLANLRLLCGGYGLGQRMGQLYHEHLFRRAAVNASTTPQHWVRSVPLHGLKIDQSSAPPLEAGQRPDRIPRLVLNATTLNTGRNFRFSAKEIGDPALGFVRFDEVWKLYAYKQLLSDCEGETSLEALGKRVGALNAKRPSEWTAGYWADWDEKDDGPPLRECNSYWLALWLASRRSRFPESGDTKSFCDELRKFVADDDDGPGGLLALIREDLDGFGYLLTAELGFLRRAKSAAWFLRIGQKRPQAMLDEVSAGGYELLLWDALHDINPVVAERNLPSFGRPERREALYEFITAIYFLRSAESFSFGLHDQLAKLTVGDAVAASANFPPVFPPFVMPDVYSPTVASPLGLTDGGVFDNQGWTALVEDRCTRIIASDAGGDLPPETVAAPYRMGMMLRLIGIFMGAIRALQMQNLRERVRLVRDISPLAYPALRQHIERRYVVNQAAFFDMSSRTDTLPERVENGLPPFPRTKLLAELRTDLDGFCDVEFDALVYHGYRLADQFVRGHGMVTSQDARLEPADPRATKFDLHDSHVERVLRNGSSRFFRWSESSRWMSALRLVAVLTLLASTLFVPHQFGQLAMGAVHRLGQAVSGVPVLGKLLGWISHWPVQTWLVAGLFWLGWFSWEGRLVRHFARWRSRRAELSLSLLRRVGTFIQRNLAWFLWLLPLWVALGLSVASAVSHALHLMFTERRGRAPPLPFRNWLHADVLSRLLGFPSERALRFGRWLGALSTVVMLGSLWMVDVGFAPFSIFRFELAFTPTRMAEILLAWGSLGQESAMNSLLMDFVFIPAYVCLGASLLIREARQMDGSWRFWLLWAVLAVVLSGGLDAVENLALMLILRDASPNLVLLASFAASAKFLLGSACAGLLCMAWGRQTLVTLRAWVGSR